MEHFVFITLLYGIRVIPITLTFRIGHLLGTIAHSLTRRYRQIVRRNLRIALYRDQPSFEEIDALTKRVFQLTGANLFSSIRTATLNPETLKKRVVVTNQHHIDDLAGSGDGCILLLAHMSNWEILAQLASLLPPGAVPGTHYRPLNNPHINHSIEKLRASQGTHLFAKRSSSHTIATFLRENGVLGILADQRAGNKAKTVSFFGRLTGFTPLPALLAKRTKAPMLGLSVKTIGVAQWELIFHPICDELTAQATASKVENILTCHIADGFWFQDRWKLDKKSPLSLPDNGENTDYPAAKTPFRALIWQDSADSPLPTIRDIRPDALLQTQCADGNTPLLEQLITLDESHLAPIEIILLSTPDSPIIAIAKKLGIPTHIYPAS